MTSTQFTKLRSWISILWGIVLILAAVGCFMRIDVAVVMFILVTMGWVSSRIINDATDAIIMLMNKPSDPGDDAS